MIGMRSPWPGTLEVFVPSVHRRLEKYEKCTSQIKLLLR